MCLSSRAEEVDGEEAMVIQDIVVHPNFTDYQHDLGNVDDDILAHL
jgi:hypothetical protein